MIERCNCIYCSNRRENLKKYKAEISPFIKNHALKSDSPKINMAYCPRCEGGFIDHAYDDSEMGNLYQG